MRWLALLLAAACGAKSPPSSPPPSNVPSSNESNIKRETWVDAGAYVSRPSIDVEQFLPDFHEDLRWPLAGMNHPSLDPRFPIAHELAIGVDWQTLCLRGVQHRTSATQKDLLAYLRGWCHVQKRDVDGACSELRPLLGSTTRGLAAAVRQDLANILVDGGDADNAEHWLSKHDIRDVRVLDLLAASYIEVGSAADAFTINRRAVDSDDRATDATKCRRLIRQIALGGNTTYAQKELAGLARPAKGQVGDPVCVELSNKLYCTQSPSTSCVGYLADASLPPEAQKLLYVYYAWPRQRSGFVVWTYFAATAVEAVPLEGAAELSITAYEAALAAYPNCSGERARDVRSAIDQLRAQPNHAVYEPRLARLAELCSEPAQPPTKP